jgi:hypothetical protein
MRQLSLLLLKHLAFRSSKGMAGEFELVKELEVINFAVYVGTLEAMCN